MQTQAASKKLPDSDPKKLSVYSFNGSIMLPTPYGQYWATAVGGTVASRPTGNPIILFEIRYVWDVSGQPMELPGPFLWRLNEATIAGEAFNFEFPSAEEVPSDDPLLLQAQAEAAVMAVDDNYVGDGLSIEDDPDHSDNDLGEDPGEDETEDAVVQAAHSGEDEISW